MGGSLCWFVLPNALQPDDIHLAESALQSKVEIPVNASAAKRAETSDKSSGSADKPALTVALRLTDLGLESEAMRIAVLEPLINYIGWPEFDRLRFVCRNCFDWLEFLAWLKWRVLAKKIMRHWHAETPSLDTLLDTVR